MLSTRLAKRLTAAAGKGDRGAHARTGTHTNTHTHACTHAQTHTHARTHAHARARTHTHAHARVHAVPAAHASVTRCCAAQSPRSVSSAAQMHGALRPRRWRGKRRDSPCAFHAPSSRWSGYAEWSWCESPAVPRVPRSIGPPARGASVSLQATTAQASITSGRHMAGGGLGLAVRQPPRRMAAAP